MTRDKKLEAIEQMKFDCQLRMDQMNYDLVSARGILYNLGFTGEETDEVIELIRLGGFTNCLDPSVYVKGVNGKVMRPGEGACYWGPDQMLSRLECLFHREVR